MATLTLNSKAQSLVAEYSVFWQLWPQFEQIHGERRMVGFEVELIGFHTSDLNHLDPACPDCRHVRSVLFGIADALPRETSFRRSYLTYNIVSAVSVSIYVFWNRSNGQSFETDLLTEVKIFLNRWGIHQR